MLVFKVLIFIVDSEIRGALEIFPFFHRKIYILGDIMRKTKRRTYSSARKSFKKRVYKKRKYSSFMKSLYKWFGFFFSLKHMKKPGAKKYTAKRKTAKRAAPKRAATRRKTTKTAAKRKYSRRKAA